MQSDLRAELLSSMETCGVVDCHSHTRMPQRYYAEGPYGIFHIMGYFERDMVYMIPMERFRACKTDEQRWPLFREALEKGRNMTYWRHAIATYQKYFGLKDDELTDENWRAVNDEMKRKTADADWYDYVSRRAVKVKTQIRNIPWFDDWFTAELVTATDEQIRSAVWQDEWDKRYFTGTLRLENALFLYRAPMVEQLAARTGTSITDLVSLKRAIDRLVDMYVEKGAIGIKLAHAYFRTLESEPVEQSVAAQAFSRAMRGETLSPSEIKQFQDHLIFYMAQLCREKDILFQIHTGLQHCFDDLRFCNPLLLTPLLSEFRDVRFDLFHAGIPFIHEFGVLCKLFPNTYANMAWTHEISTAMTRQALSECIDLIPGHRILGFGSDVKYPELIGGALDMAFSVTADVLVDKVARDFLSRAEAKSLISKLFYQNGCELYRI